MRFMFRGYRVIIFEISSEKYLQEIKMKLIGQLHKIDEEMKRSGK